MSFDLPRRADREYLHLCGIGAIYVVSIPYGEPCIIDATRDLEQSFRVWRQRWAWSEIVAAYWMQDRDTTENMVDHVAARLPHDRTGRLAVAVDRVRREIIGASGDLDIKLTEHDAVMLRVRAATKRVRDLLVQANARGDLAWFNSAFRVYRLARLGPMNYVEARARLRRVITKRLVQTDSLEIDKTMLSEVFGDISTAIVEAG